MSWPSTALWKYVRRIMMANFNIIKPSVTRIDEKDNLKRIELAGRVCYKSEKKITEESARGFCTKILQRGHTSVLEHSNVIVKMPVNSAAFIFEAMSHYEYKTNKIAYLKCTHRNGGMVIISGNVRAWREVLDAFKIFTFFEHPLLDTDGGQDLTCYLISEDELTDEERQIHSRITLRITCDRGVSHELVRHRVMSFSQESTRYLNYGKRGYTFIEPWWWEHQNGVIKHLMVSEMAHSIDVYQAMIDEGATPQLARAVLPNQIKTEVVVTATPLQWAEFLKLRLAEAAHPDMQRIAHLVRDALGDDVTIEEEMCDARAVE